MPESNQSVGAVSIYNDRGGLIQSPDINSKGTPEQRSIKDAAMARDVVKVVIQANRNRTIVDSRIQAKINAERPYDSTRLESEGLGWKQNFTTKPLPSLAEKIAPRFVEAVNGLKYLTSSALSEKWENSSEKTDRFRKKTTEVIRKRKGWRTLVEDIAFNNAVFGSDVVGVLDEFSWFPTNFKTGEVFLNDGVKQEARLCQLAVLKELLLPHELFEKIKDREAAQDFGYRIQATIDEINKASPNQLREQLNVGGTLEQFYQNAIRELTLGASYMAGASVVAVYNLLVQEVTGKVSHYMLAGDALNEIFVKEDRFENMESCLTFFSYQKGNGTMHGSKGIGRDLYELAGMLDRTRNEVVDRGILSGKILAQCDPRQLHKFKMSIIGAMAIVPAGFTFLEQKVDGDIEPFLKLDAYFSMLADQLVGNTSPPTASGQGEAFRSSAAWQLLAAREEEGKDAKVGRFLEQFTDMVQLMQHRIYDPDTREDDAKQAQKDLLEYMTREELDELRKQPVSETIRDLTPLERQMRVAIVAEKQGNPLYDQRALQIEDLSARADAEFIEKVLLPANDPTEQAEQVRFQNLETLLLSSGQPVPISPRDNHVLHVQALMPVAQQMAQSLMTGELSTPIFEAVISHIQQHYEQARAQGVPKETLAEIEAFIKKAGPALEQLKELDEQAQQTAELSQTLETAQQLENEMGIAPV
jgi:hypothetical protein